MQITRIRFAEAIAAPQPLAVVDTVAVPVAMDHLLVDDALAAPITMPSCRGRRRRGAGHHAIATAHLVDGITPPPSTSLMPIS